MDKTEERTRFSNVIFYSRGSSSRTDIFPFICCQIDFSDFSFGFLFSIFNFWIEW